MPEPHSFCPVLCCCCSYLLQFSPPRLLLEGVVFAFFGSLEKRGRPLGTLFVQASTLSVPLCSLSHLKRSCDPCGRPTSCCHQKPPVPPLLVCQIAKFPSMRLHFDQESSSPCSHVLCKQANYFLWDVSIWCCNGDLIACLSTPKNREVVVPVCFYV